MQEGYLYIEEGIYPTLLALTEWEQTRGLQFQSWKPPTMSFIYASPRINKFWMYNTPSPLDVIFSYRGKITQICRGEPNSSQVMGDNSWSDLIVEMPQGAIQQHQIKLGHCIGLTYPSFSELKSAGAIF